MLGAPLLYIETTTNPNGYYKSFPVYFDTTLRFENGQITSSQTPAGSWFDVSNDLSLNQGITLVFGCKSTNIQITQSSGNPNVTKRIANLKCREDQLNFGDDPRFIQLENIRNSRFTYSTHDSGTIVISHGISSEPKPSVMSWWLWILIIIIVLVLIYIGYLVWKHHRSRV